MRSLDSPMASRVDLDLCHWTMCLAPFHLIHIAIEMASEAASFFSVVDYLSCITIAHYSSHYKIKPSYAIVR